MPGFETPAMRNVMSKANKISFWEVSMKESALRRNISEYTIVKTRLRASRTAPLGAPDESIAPVHEAVNCTTQRRSYLAVPSLLVRETIT